MEYGRRRRDRPGAAHLRAQVVRVGLLASTVASAASGFYLLATPEGPYRPLLWALLTTSVLVTAAMIVAERRRLIRRRNAIRMLHAWAGIQVAIIAASAALDGGPSSPYVALLFLPMVAGAIGFPPRAVLVHGVWTSFCLLAGAAFAGVLTLSMALMWVAAIGSVSGVATSTARSLLSLSADLDRANRRLEHLARVDSLTGCLNHGAFHQQLQIDLARRARGGEPISLLALDVDHFKRVNDEHGHPVGDEVLRVLGRVLREHVRPGDIVGRMGGEEFAILLPSTLREDAEAVGQRIRLAVAATEDAPVPITVSVGLAAVPPTGWTANELMRTADEALYEAKRTGRDRLVTADGMAGPEREQLASVVDLPRSPEALA